VTGSRPVWTAGSPPAGSLPAGSAPAGSFACLAQLRAHAAAVPAVATVGAGTVEVRLLEPVRGVATGQAVVLYDGDVVLGSATVSATARVEPAEAGSIVP